MAASDEPETTEKASHHVSRLADGRHARAHTLGSDMAPCGPSRPCASRESRQRGPQPTSSSRASWRRRGATISGSGRGQSRPRQPPIEQTQAGECVGAGVTERGRRAPVDQRGDGRRGRTAAVHACGGNPAVVHGWTIRPRAGIVNTSDAGRSVTWLKYLTRRLSAHRHCAPTYCIDKPSRGAYCHRLCARRGYIEPVWGPPE